MISKNKGEKTMKKLLVLISLLFLLVGCSSNFEQVGYYINSSGGRVLSFYVKNVDWEEIEKHAIKQTIYFSNPFTAVFYFNNRSNTPNVTYCGIQFPDKYERYCVAAYWIYPNKTTKFSKYPFKKK
jgi:hypothetical protein